MKKLLSFAAIATLGFAFNIMPYGAYLKYSKKSLKDNGYVAGIYASYFNSPYKIELDLEQSLIKYKSNANMSDWNQGDLTIIGNYYKGYNLAFKAGIHNILSKQGSNKEYDKVFILGGMYYEYLKFNMAADFYLGDYSGFNTYQFSPKIGFNFGNYYSESGSFYIEGKYNLIHITNNKTSQSNYSNFDFKLQNFKGPWTTTLNAAIGKNAYKVANGGFVVYNLGEEYKYSAGIDVSYTIDKISNIKVGYTVAKFTDNNQDVFSNIYTISYLRAF
ncbi:hypothetical protein JCM11957_05960 [Caminibacter profundus]